MGTRILGLAGGLVLPLGSLAIACVIGCSERAVSHIPENRPLAYVDADGSHESSSIDTLRNPMPHLRFADGQVSLNDRCPVRLAPLNVRLPGLYVNGRPVGFC